MTAPNKTAERALRDTFGAYPTGVTIVTARGTDGQAVGFTANSFTSVSLNPPLLLVCANKKMSSFLVFDACAHFAVSILSEGQHELAQRFATFSGDRFDGIATTNDTFENPLIKGAVAYFSCSVWSRVPAGDHTILLGKVEAFDQQKAQSLAYLRGKYAQVQPLTTTGTASNVVRAFPAKRTGTTD